jgi:hypothetical protein
MARPKMRFRKVPLEVIRELIEREIQMVKPPEPSRRPQTARRKVRGLGRPRTKGATS